MFELAAVPLGAILLITGLAFILLTYLMLRVVTPRASFARQAETATQITSDLPVHEEAVLMVEAGGRVTYMNQRARAKFNVWDEDPNLERLARRARPSDTFLGLCAAEGHASFSIDGQMMQGTSYVVPNVKANAVLLSLRQYQVRSLDEKKVEHSRQTIEVLTELSQSMAANLELDATLQAILASVEQLVPTDFAEINIWDAENQNLVPYRFVGLSGPDRYLETTAERYPIGEGYSGYVAEQREIVLIGDVDAHRELRPIIDRQKYPFRSYLGIPLLIGGELIGTLDLTSLSRDAYSQNDADVVQLLSGQAAIALHNALLYREEKRRSLELSSLANLAQAAGAAHDSTNLFSHLVDAIAPLLDAEIVGFLLYDEPHRTLWAQNPFVGIPPQFVEIYQTTIAAESPADLIWREQKTLIVSDAPDDPTLSDLGLNHPARAAGIRHTVLQPLKVAGRSLGYLQAANKYDNAPFTDDDVRLMTIIAGQAAPIIDNAKLMQQSVQRAMRSESLRRIASLSSSEALIDEILKYSVIELARLLDADVAAIFFFDERVGLLQIHADSVYGVSPSAYQSLSHLSVERIYFEYIVSNSKQAFISDNLVADQRVLPPYRTLIEALEIKSAMDLPLIVRDQGIGELLLGSRRVEQFSSSDIQLAMTVAGQLAVAVERATLASQTDANLQQDIKQLKSLTQIGRNISTSLSLSDVLKQVYEGTLKITEADCGAVLLFAVDEEKTNSSKVSMQAGDNLDDWPLLAHWMAQKRGPVVADDFDRPHPEIAASLWQPPHEGIRSALVVPISRGEQVVGVIQLHASQPRHFDDNLAQLIQSLAAQAFIAVDNARRYGQQQRHNQDLRQRAKMLADVFDASQQVRSGQLLEIWLGEIAASIQQMASFDAVWISLYHAPDDTLVSAAGVGISAAYAQTLKDEAHAWGELQKWILPEYRIGRAYFIPAKAALTTPAWLHLISSSETHTQDLLFTVMFDALGEPLGALTFALSKANQPPDAADLETLDLFVMQAAAVIGHYRQVLQLENQLQGLATELSTAQTSAADILEEQRLVQLERRVRAGLETVELLNRQPDRDTVLKTLGQALIEQFEMDAVLVAEIGADGPHLMFALGDDLSDKTNLSALLGQRNPLYLSLQTGQTYWSEDIAGDETWHSVSLLHALGAKSFISLPILAQAGSSTAILAVRGSPFSAFSLEDEQLFNMLARHASTALNNLALLNETGQRYQEVNLLLEFNRQLSGQEPTRVLHILLESALGLLHRAESGMILTLDSHQKVLRPKIAMGYLNDEIMLNIAYRLESTVMGRVFSAQKASILEKIDFAQDYNLARDDLLQYRQSVGSALPTSNLVVPIRAQQDVLGVLVLESFQETQAFSLEDQMLVGSLTRQAALALENIQLYQATQQRALQLQALSDVAATIAVNLEVDVLIEILLETLSNIVPYDASALWLRNGDMLAIRAARGFDESAELVGLTTRVEDSQLFEEMFQTREPLSIADVRADQRFPDVEAARFSWLGMPLNAKGEMLGVLALEKKEADYYTPEHIQMLTTFSNQAAVALENADLYHQSVERTAALDQRSQRLVRINHFANEISNTLDLAFLLKLTCDELLAALSGSAVSAILYRQEQPELWYDTSQPLDAVHQMLPKAPIFDRLRQSLGIFSAVDVNQEDDLMLLTDFFLQHKTQSLLILPLTTGDETHGFIFVHENQPYRFTADEVDLARIMTNQAAVSVQNASLFAQTKSLTEELEQRVEERTQQLQHEHWRSQALLRIMQALSASLDLDHLLNNTLRLLNEITNAEQSTILLAIPGENTFYYRASLGYTDPPPHGGRNTSLKLRDGLAGWVFDNGQGVLIDDLQSDQRWVALSDTNLTHRSALVVPLAVGAEKLGVMLIFHRDSYHFIPDQMEMVQAAANQIAVSVNNAELFNLVQDQSRDLGIMLREQKVENSRSRAILEAVADGVLVTDLEHNITLFNASAQHVLSMEQDGVVGKTLADFMGLFGQAAQSWMETIQMWTTDQKLSAENQTYAERITLDNGRYVSVNLAPVLLEDEFLGTVSIFRDITHEVEVDRMKSEFVATVSHELRTPMTSIKGYVEILLMGAAGELSEQQKHFLEVVQINTERLNILVNDLLDVSRIEAGKVDIIQQPLRLSKLVEVVIAEQLRRAEADQRKFTITSELSAELPKVEGDEERVQQILTNLVRNAYHYTSAGGHIVVRGSVVGDAVQIDIQDDGIGIPSDEQTRVFERFYRGEDPLVLATAGTGLGLAIVRQLVEMHHGRIWVESNGVPGAGSTFSFTLPIYQKEKR